MFHQALRESGIMQESKQYYSGKHHLCCLETEVSVLPSGQAIDCSATHPGSVANIENFRQNMQWHTNASRNKSRIEFSLDDGSELHERHVDKWAIVCNKPNTGLQQSLCVICPAKTLLNGMLTAQSKVQNQQVSHDPVRVEN